MRGTVPPCRIFGLSDLSRSQWPWTLPRRAIKGQVSYDRAILVRACYSGSVKVPPPVTRRGQPNQSGSARRAQIIDCAVDALCELGFAGASVGEIARRAGVSKGVVTYHFPDKNALLTTIVTDLYTTAGERIARRIEASDNSAEALRGYLEANLGFIADHPRQVRASMEVMAGLRPNRDDPAPADPVTDHLADLLRTGQRDGEFGDFDAHSVALVLRAAIDSAARLVVADPAFDFATYRRELIALAQRATTHQNKGRSRS